MRIFISWSGDQSKKIAETLRKWFPSVIQAAKPYYSPDDIAKGAKWSSEIAKELEASKVGILCLTSDNITAPWIMFEAGALSKQIDQSKVCPILFGIDPSEIQGPLVQFQAAKFSKDEIYKVLKTINSELVDGKLDSETLSRVFEMWWPQLNEEVEKIMTEIKEQKKDKRPDRDILEEILSLQRETALIQSRSKKGEVAIHREAVLDFVNGYSQLAEGISVLTGNLNALTLCDSLKTINRPIKYILQFSDLPLSTRREYMLKIEQANELIADIVNRTSLENGIEIDKE